MREYDESELEAMLNDCGTWVEKMNDWECKFVASVGDRLDSGIMLSEKEVNKLTDIWNRIT